MNANEIAMQARCVHCLREQYAPAVLGISNGEEPCVWCGKKSTPMTYAEWQEALENRRKEKGIDKHSQ